MFPPEMCGPIEKKEDLFPWSKPNKWFVWLLCSLLDKLFGYKDNPTIHY
jgi:hypothetical protein